MVVAIAIAAATLATIQRLRARAQANAEKWGTTAFADLAALVAAGANVIHVLTPPSSHCKVATAALEAGCHVLIEKPISEDADEAVTALTSSPPRHA